MSRTPRNRIQPFLAGFLLLLILIPQAVKADQATSYTYTLDDKGEYIRTQDAYLPDRTLSELGLSSPSDLFIDANDLMYIADTGNRRIIIYDIRTGRTLDPLTDKGFSSPAACS